jgi:hypothetical protein
MHERVAAPSANKKKQRQKTLAVDDLKGMSSGTVDLCGD